MHREIRELELADLWRPKPGTVAPWVRGVVSGSAVAMIGVAATASRALWDVGGHASGWGAFWFRNGLAIVTAALISVAFLPSCRTTRFVRLAALLPVVMAAGMLAAWGLWEMIDPALPVLRRRAPLALGVPIPAALLTIAAATVAGALAARRRRGREGAWTRAVVEVALLELLLLGLWLPVVSGWWGSRPGVGWLAQERGVLVLGSAAALLAAALGPPLVAAAGFAALAARRPALVRRLRGLWTSALIALFVAAVVARLAAPAASYLIYVNLVGFLAASAFVAAAALAAFVAELALRAWRGRRRLTRDGAAVRGVIASDGDRARAGGGDRADASVDVGGVDVVSADGGAGGDRRGVVAALEIEGWLRGPRALVDAFEVVTPAGRIPIPVGAALAASLPALSTVLRVGESVAVLRRGDPVVISGLVAPPADHPFRGAAVLVPGPRGVVVGRPGDGGGGFASIALVAWRPCVALLAILVAVAAPGLAAVLVLP